MMRRFRRGWFLLPVFMMASTASAADYTIDWKHTRATFEIGHMGLSTFRGRFDKTEGTISYDPQARSGSAKVTISVASASTGVPDLDKHLQAAEFFDAAKFPTIVFQSTAFTFEGEKLASVTGNLTIKGVTKPVTLKVLALTCKAHPMTKAPACGAELEARVVRSQYGVSAYVPAVDDEVLLRIEVEALAAAK